MPHDLDDGNVKTSRFANDRVACVVLFIPTNGKLDQNQRAGTDLGKSEVKEGVEQGEGLMGSNHLSEESGQEDGC